MKFFNSKDDRHRVRLASALQKNRIELSRALFAAVRDKDCAAWKGAQRFDEVEEWGRAQLLTAIDLLAAWFRTRDPVLQELFAGWVHSRLVSDLSNEGAPADYKSYKAIEFAKNLWIAILGSQVSSEAIQLLRADLDRIAHVLSEQTLKELRVLFIGDCIQFEIITSLMARCVHTQISVKPTLFNERVQPLFRNRIRTFGNDEFDLVFFSPFSHRNLPEYEALLGPKSLFWSNGEIARRVNAMLAEVCGTLDVLAGQFHCPIYVHNTAAAVQSFGELSGLAKSLVSQRGRSRARKFINDGIARYLNNPQLESRVLLLDEDGLRSRHGERALGRVYLNSYALHPTRLGVELGRALYADAVYSTAFLSGKKVVVCDLDNTLWDGVIGEGPVEHYLGRQCVLKELRRRGVLLSINSKNDPHNIRWSDALLQADDFVAPQINWKPKAANMADIRDELNLKLKDFVFIDDRPDELARIHDAFPEILVLDATCSRTWDLLSCWYKSLPSNPQEDRTTLYHQRVKREQFVSGMLQSSTLVEDETSALKALEISVKIQEAGRSGLKRAAELINRTNQFNLCGTRTTARELEGAMDGPHSIITAEASDKFGSMGVVGIMRVEWKPGRAEIPIFVLSCRAFGFGIEYSMLNALRKLAPGDHVVIGHYKETQFNQPCRQFYPTSGMKWDGSTWVGALAELRPDPVWLAIRIDIAAKPVEVATIEG
jgi:FkbH-like protein